MKKILTLISFLAGLISLGSCSSNTTVYFNKETKSRPVIVARLEAQPGKTAELINRIEKMVENTRKESGCLCYNVYQDIEAPTKFIIYEVYESEDALQKHIETAYLKNFRNTKSEVLEGESILETFERSVAPMPKSSENGLVLFANIKAIEGKATELQTILENLIPPTLAEEGAEHYELHKLKGSDNDFMYHETWTTLAHWDAHMKTKHLVDFLNIKSNYVGGDINISKTKQIF